LADKLTTLLLDALGRAALAPGGTPLFGTRSAPGLFPGSALARQAAQRARDDGLLRLVAPDPGGKADRDLYAPSDQGLAYLFGQTSPKQVLEDLLRAVEARHDQLAGLITAARQTQSTLDAVKSLVAEVLPRLAARGFAAPAPPADWSDALCDHLARWDDGAPGDCPLPELYRRLTADHPGLTVGQFHDGLRDLHDQQRVYLHPWTGPLYALPEPAFALLIGHEIAYYASSRQQAAGSGQPAAKANGREDARTPCAADAAPLYRAFA
jgi:hypothetical protein